MTRGRPTVGLLLDSLVDAYQNALYCGVLERTREADANLLCFSGGIVASGAMPRSPRNAVFDLASPRSVDAMVLVSGPLAQFVGAEGLARYCSRFRPLPAVSISVPVPAMPSVGVDDAAGTREAIDHLIRVHGRRSIAFVGGPRWNGEAELRYRAYLDALEAHGIGPAEDRILFGDFNLESGEQAILGMGQEQRRSLDAIVVANDLMALGVMQALRGLGIRVPDDVAVVGFDDLEQARFSTPPLTTVRQPFRLLGATAVDVALALLRGERVEDRTLLPTRLIARRSCGCRSQLEAAVGEGQRSGSDAVFDEMTAAERARVVDELAAVLDPAPTDRDRTVAKDLLVALAREARGGAGSDGFLVSLEKTLRTRLDRGAETGVFHEVLAALRQFAVSRLPVGSERREAFERLFQDAHAVVGRYADMELAEHRSRAEALTRALGEVSESLLTTFDGPTLLGSLAERLPRLGIPSAYVSTYPDTAGRSEVLFAFDGAQPAATPNPGWFSTGQLIPPAFSGAASPHAFIVQPLFFKHEPFGFGLFEAGPTDGIVYETLRDQLSAAIEGADLVQKVVAHDRARRRLLRYILDVTPEMHRVQPLDDLLQSILVRVTAMLDTGTPAHAPDGFVALLAEGGRLSLRTGTGRFADPSAVPAELLEQAKGVLSSGTIHVAGHATVLALTAGRETQIGAIWIDRAADEAEAELLAAFANQASAAIRSMQLYEMAALDPLTGVHARRFFDDWLEREVRAAYQSHEPLTLLMVDMDKMKQINDTGGHLAGDEALAAVGRVLRKTTRTHDVVGRYGGDEFAVILPQTTIEEGEAVGDRLVESIEGRTIATSAGKLSLRISVGVGTLAWENGEGSVNDAKVESGYFRSMAHALVGCADEALYRSKRAGGMKTVRGAMVTWRPL